MIKGAPYIVSLCCAGTMLALIGWHKQPVVVSEAEPAEVRTVEPYRCIECNPHGLPFTQSESLSAAPDDNARNFKTVITKMSTGKYYLRLETKNLIFREATMQDIDAIYTYARKEMVAARTAWQPHANKLTTIRQVEKWVQAYKDGRIAPWAVEEKATGTLIGTAGIPLIYEGRLRAQFSYCIGDAGWGNEYEIEVVRALLEYMFVRVGITRAEALARADDPFSQKVLMQAGMSCEGEQPEYKPVGSEHLSFKQYSLIRHDVTDALKRSVLRK